MIRRSQLSRTLVTATAIAAATAACIPPGPPARPGGAVSDTAVAARATLESIARHTRELASDRYEGRFPGTRGEELTVAYLESRMRRLGLEAGNPDGTYVQWFEISAQRNRISGTITRRGRTEPLSLPDEALFVVTGGASNTTIRDSELVFVGYGITAPEYGWDDYSAVDVRGKTVLVMAGEPEIRLGSDSSRFDPAHFRGAQLTWHAIPEQKRENAAVHGAVAIVFVTRGLGGLRTQMQLWGGEYLTLGTERWPSASGFFLPAFARRVFAEAGRDFTADSLAAGRRGFRAAPLGTSLSLDVETQWRRIPTRNVVGRLPGSDPALRDEHVILSAHWDGFGIGPAVDGDSIYNGAVDDAVGIGQMLAIAEALASTARRAHRSILFLATSAEEPGLLGARHYAAHPLYPLERAVANLNYDLVNLAGATRDVTVYGAGRTSLEDHLAAAARLQGRIAGPESAAQSDTWFYQDHFAFARAGVPALSIGAGRDVIGRPAGYSEQRSLEYRTRHYHRPSDEIRDDWDWGSIVQNAQLGVLLALRLGNAETRPTWIDRAEFGTAPGR